MIVAELYMSTIQDRSIFYIPRYAADKKAYPSNNIRTCTHYMYLHIIIALYYNYM